MRFRPTSDPLMLGSLACYGFRMNEALLDRITFAPGKRGGQPTIRGLRITVYDVLHLLADGADEAQILADFPELEADDIRACLAWAAERERKTATLVAQ